MSAPFFLSSAVDSKGLLSGQFWGELRIFAEIARSRSFEKAAERLGLSRPTIDRKVRRLEDLIGTKLLVSSKHSVRLTKRGEELVDALLVFDQSLFSITNDLKAKPADENNVRKIMDVYSHFKTKPGEALDTDHFLGVGRLRRWDVNDLQNGIEEAYRNGLVEEGDRGWSLTEAGYREATRLR